MFAISAHMFRCMLKRWWVTHTGPPNLVSANSCQWQRCICFSVMHHRVQVNDIYWLYNMQNKWHTHIQALINMWTTRSPELQLGGKMIKDYWQVFCVFYWIYAFQNQRTCENNNNIHVITTQTVSGDIVQTQLEDWKSREMWRSLHVLKINLVLKCLLDIQDESRVLVTSVV